jgi:hypothetical protein
MTAVSETRSRVDCPHWCEVEGLHGPFVDTDGLEYECRHARQVCFHDIAGEISIAQGLDIAVPTVVTLAGVRLNDGSEFEITTVQARSLAAMLVHACDLAEFHD